MSLSIDQAVGMIELHPDSSDELGRLLALRAHTPFTILGFPNPNRDDHQWTSMAELLAYRYHNYYYKLEGPETKRRRKNLPSDGGYDSHKLWLSPQDETRIVDAFRQKIQTYRYLQQLLVESEGAMVFTQEHNRDDIEPTLSWLTSELDLLRKYFRKSLKQGFHQPFIRPGSKRPFVW